MLVVGLGDENFASLSPELVTKFAKMYEQPEMFIRINGEMRAFPIIREGVEEADKIAGGIIELFSASGFEGYADATPEQLKQTAEALSIIVRSGEDFPLRRNLLEIAESKSDCSKEALAQLKQLDAFYEQQRTLRYLIYQVPFEGEKIRNLCYRSYEDLKADNISVDARNYFCQYSGRLRAGQTLDDLYEKFNLHRPTDFLGHSMSVSDVVVLNQYGSPQAFYVDSFGFTPVPEFFDHNPLAKVEELLEDDYGMIDGIINNGDKAKENDYTKPSMLERLQEKKLEADEINRNRQKPYKSRSQDHELL